MIFEHKQKALAPTHVFARRLALSVLVAAALTTASLAIGMVGYHATEDLAWIDAFHNSAMILTGMGPVASMGTTAGKLFASFYALFSGVVFVSSAAILLAPLVHRFMHRFHLGEDEEG